MQLRLFLVFLSRPLFVDIVQKESELLLNVSYLVSERRLPSLLRCDTTGSSPIVDHQLVSMPFLDYYGLRWLFDASSTTRKADLVEVGVEED